MSESLPAKKTNDLLPIPPAPLARRRRWIFLLIVVGTIGAYASMLAARGNGWSPLIFLLLGAIGTPTLARLLVRYSRGRRWTARLVAILAICAISYGLAKCSTRIDPAQAYAKIFNSAPPLGMTLIKARTQWFDGQEFVISFQADRAAVDAMRVGHAYEDRTDGIATYHVYLASFLNIADFAPARPTNGWSYIDQKSDGGFTAADILWDATTGRGMVRWLWS